jgi:proline dehydrogenase
VSLMRKALLAASTNVWMREHVTKYPFVRRSVSKFMPGERTEDALGAAKELQAGGITTILTHLGENLTRPDEAEAVTRHYLDLLDRISASGLDAQISIKPTQLGLDLDRALCERNLDRLVERAAERNNFVWIDMESSPYVDPTIDLFRRTRAQTTRVGIALQAYLRRTARDVESLLPLGSAIRIVKGAYLEPPDVAFPKKSDVDENFYTLCVRLLSEESRGAGGLLHIGTHDIALIDRLSLYIAEHTVPASAYEYAMLYGIQRGRQQRLASDGKRLRVLISYGEYWYPWYVRRLAERPANIWFVAKNMMAR